MNDGVVICEKEDMRARFNIALLGAETGGQLSMRVQEVKPGEGTPLHLHEAQAETFHVVAGSFLFQVGEECVRGEPGFTVHIPKQVPHCFLYPDTGKNASGTLISVLTPGIHDGFIKNIPEAEAKGVPMTELTAMALTYGAKIVGGKIEC